jgi:hypothetical protein
MPITRTFTVAELEGLGVPPDSPDEGDWTDGIFADEHITVLKYSQKRRVVFSDDDGDTWAVEYEAPLDMGDFEVGGGDGTDDHGWHGDTVTATAMEQREVTVTKWLPIETEATP